MSPKIAIGIALAGAFALGAIIVSTNSGADETPAKGAFSNAQQDEIREIMRSYLLDNPEIIIDALQEFQRREDAQASAEATQAVRDNLIALLDPTYGYVTGKDTPNAKVAVIEFYDYHCGFCKRATPLINDLIEADKDVKMVFRELPILREESERAAEAALAAREQGKFIEMHFAMMSAQGLLNEERLSALAAEHGLNIAEFNAKREDKSIDKAIDETRALAAALGISGTPAFIVTTLDGAFVEIISGFQPDAVNRAIAAAKESA